MQLLIVISEEKWDTLVTLYLLGGINIKLSNHDFTLFYQMIFFQGRKKM
jgi:hypothetical protein